MENYIFCIKNNKITIKLGKNDLTKKQGTTFLLRGALCENIWNETIALANVESGSYHLNRKPGTKFFFKYFCFFTFFQYLADVYH